MKIHRDLAQRYEYRSLSIISKIWKLYNNFAFSAGNFLYLHWSACNELKSDLWLIIISIRSWLKYYCIVHVFLIMSKCFFFLENVSKRPIDLRTEFFLGSELHCIKISRIWKFSFRVTRLYFDRAMKLIKDSIPHSDSFFFRSSQL